MTLCDPATLAAVTTFDCLSPHEKELATFDMLVALASAAHVECELSGDPPPCEWNRFSEREKWAVILWAICSLANYLDRSACAGSTCREEFPNDFLSLKPDKQQIALMALLCQFAQHYDAEYDCTSIQDSTRCLTRTQRLDLLLQIALEWLECLQIDTDPNVLMCGSTNPYWNVQLQEVPAWLFSTLCSLYLVATEPQ